jgi:hypothetical protein
MTLSQAHRFMQTHGCADKDLLIRRWRELKLSLGVACIPKPTRAPTSAELDQLVGFGMTYGEWKGTTGRGALLRKILAEDRSAT